MTTYCLRQIDANGIFVKDVLFDDMHGTLLPTPDLIAAQIPNGYFYILKWNGAQWVEGDPNAAAKHAADSAAVVAAAAQDAQDLADTTAAKAYAKLTALKGKTPAQVQTWVTNNVTNLAQAQDAIATLAIAVSILARRL